MREVNAKMNMKIAMMYLAASPMAVLAMTFCTRGAPLAPMARIWS